MQEYKNQEQSTKTISPQQLRETICSNGQCYVLDVRTTPEFREVHLQKNCLHMPLDTLDAAKIRAAFPDATKPIFILCKGGKRAMAAAEKLKANGIANTIVVDGGLDACVACGVDVARSNVMPLERQVRMAAGALVMLGVILGGIISPVFYYLSGFVGAGLFMAGLTGWCGLALLLAKAPWNK